MHRSPSPPGELVGSSPIRERQDSWERVYVTQSIPFDSGERTHDDRLAVPPYICLSRHGPSGFLFLWVSGGGALRHRACGDPRGLMQGRAPKTLRTASPHTSMPSLIGILVTEYFFSAFSSWAQLFKREKKKINLYFICSEAKKRARGKKFTSDLTV